MATTVYLGAAVSKHGGEVDGPLYGLPSGSDATARVGTQSGDNRIYFYSHETGRGISTQTGSEYKNVIAVNNNGDISYSGGQVTGNLTLGAAPTADSHAATKKYVDDAVAKCLKVSSFSNGTLATTN